MKKDDAAGYLWKQSFEEIKSREVELAGGWWDMGQKEGTVPDVGGTIAELH